MCVEITNMQVHCTARYPFPPCEFIPDVSSVLTDMFLLLSDHHHGEGVEVSGALGQALHLQGAEGRLKRTLITVLLADFVRLLGAFRPRGGCPIVHL